MKKFEKLNKDKRGNKKKSENKNPKCLNCLKYVGCGVIGLAIGVTAMYILWPSRIATLKNGEQKIISVAGENITANDLYEELKKGDPVTASMNLIDGIIFKKKYPGLDKEAMDYAKEKAEEVYKNYEAYYGYSKAEFLKAEGFDTEDVFLNYLKEDYYYQKYYDDYTKSIITDKDINDYYKNDVIGDKEVVIFTGSKDDLEKVRTNLKNKKSIDDIKKKLTKVEVNEVKVTYLDKSSYSTEVWKKIKSTKASSYSAVIEEQNYGNTVIYVKSEKDKADLKDIKSNIEELVVKEKQSSDATLKYVAFEELRKEEKLKFYDTELGKKYDDYVKSYK